MHVHNHVISEPSKNYESRLHDRDEQFPSNCKSGSLLRRYFTHTLL